jgi:uncharacterized protein
MGLEGGTSSADGSCRMRRATAVRRRRTSKAMTLEELEDWIDHLHPPPLVDGVSMLDGYMAAIIVGPCSISPYEWMEHMLGAHGEIGMDGSTQAAAMMGVVARFNAVSEGLATAPEHYAPIFERTDDGTVLAQPWCMGFLAAIKLRRNAWQPLLTLSRIEHGLLLPILLHCTDEAGRPMLGPTRPGPEGEEFLRTAYHDIPVVVPAIREYWMPQRACS